MSGHSILILEDDPGSAEAFESMLMSCGHIVRTVGDVASGLREVERALPCAVVVDLHLPLGDGLQFLRRVRPCGGRGGVPAALVTGDYLIDDRVTDELDALGVPLHFKPLWLEDLVAMVDGLVRRCGICPQAGK